MLTGSTDKFDQTNFVATFLRRSRSGVWGGAPTAASPCPLPPLATPLACNCKPGLPHSYIPSFCSHKQGSCGHAGEEHGSSPGTPWDPCELRQSNFGLNRHGEGVGGSYPDKNPGRQYSTWQQTPRFEIHFTRGTFCDSVLDLFSFLEIEDVVNAVLFLLSDKSAMTTGCTFPVEGGFWCQ